MSSPLLNVSNDADGRPAEFGLKDIDVFVVSEEPNWLKQTHQGKFLGLEDNRTSLNDLEKCEILTRQELVPTRRSTLGWSGNKDQQNKTDKFLLVYGVMYVIVNSRKDKGKALKEHILRNIVQCGFDARIKEIQGEHNQQTGQLHQTIQEQDNRIQAIQYENVGLQGKIRQHGYRRHKARVFLARNQGSTLFADGDTPNAIVTYNLWREHRLIVVDPNRPRHFMLDMINQEQLLALNDT